MLIIEEYKDVEHAMTVLPGNTQACWSVRTSTHPDNANVVETLEWYCREFRIIKIRIEPAPEEQEAIRRYITGERPKFSTGIHERLTYGYGQLDPNGFWEFPLPYQALSEVDRYNVDLIDSEFAT